MMNTMQQPGPRPRMSMGFPTMQQPMAGAAPTGVMPTAPAPPAAVPAVPPAMPAAAPAAPTPGSLMGQGNTGGHHDKTAQFEQHMQDVMARQSVRNPGFLTRLQDMQNSGFYQHLMRKDPSHDWASFIQGLAPAAAPAAAPVIPPFVGG
jgi:hypothetical protein